MRAAILAAALAVALTTSAPGMAHVTNRTHYHTVNGKRVWYRAASRPAVHTAVAGWYGHIARHATLKNRNLVIDFDNGHRRTVEVPKNIIIRRNGKQVSVHSLDSNDRVRVWAYRIPGEQGAWRATRVIAY